LLRRRRRGKPQKRIAPEKKRSSRKGKNSSYKACSVLKKRRIKSQNILHHKATMLFREAPYPNPTNREEGGRDPEAGTLKPVLISVHEIESGTTPPTEKFQYLLMTSKKGKRSRACRREDGGRKTLVRQLQSDRGEKNHQTVGGIKTVDFQSLDWESLTSTKRTVEYEKGEKTREYFQTLNEDYSGENPLSWRGGRRAEALTRN